MVSKWDQMYSRIHWRSVGYVEALRSNKAVVSSCERYGRDESRQESGSAKEEGNHGEER